MSTSRRGPAAIAPPAAPVARRIGARHRAALASLLACTSLAVQAGDCTIGTTPINFGVYDPITGTGPVDSTGTVSVQCRTTTLGELFGGVNVSIALSQGSSGSYAARTLRQPPGSVLQYNLYTSAARTIVWGNGSGGTGTISGTLGGLLTGQPSTRNFTIYGRVPPGQDPNLGLHSDTITVTVTF